MRLKVCGSRTEGRVLASPSKSYTHRAMTLALLSEGISVLRRPLRGADTLATLDAVRSFGGIVKEEGELNIEGGHLRCPDDVVDAKNSGTTIRLMAGIASLIPCATVLTGDESIRRRPMQPLIEALTMMDVRCESTRGNGLAPLIVKGPNKGEETSIRGDVSSQFISSLLISSAAKDVDTTIRLTTPLKSRPYVDITMDMMSLFGAKAESTSDGFFVPGGQRYRPRDYTVPGDFSSAAFPLAAGALTGEVTVRNLDPNDRQGDRRFLDILQELGAEVLWNKGDLRCARGRLIGREIDLGDAPDLFPIVAVLCTQAEGESRIFNAAHVRLKESDRISATTTFLKAMGADVIEKEDGCVVRGHTALKGATVSSLKDHRILMAAAVAALVAEGDTFISDGDCHRISYPDFVKDMRSLGAKMEMIS
ncbi:MAG TPA: 3-phosphoshikimate 1-carboxyvinyltransferase [Methanomassiliicoccales archaeon]|nr:3-phosphoshikimate 1-carboxyvinyltransferase [Methanomassiliicoccales archaeon]